MNPRIPRSWATLAIVALTMSACGAGPKGTTPSEAAVGVRAAGCSLVDSFGTGVAVAPRLIATSAHTIAGASVVSVVVQNGTEHAATVVAFSASQDVAILEVADSIAYAALGETAKGDVGVLTTWNPNTDFAASEVSVLRMLRVTIEDIYVAHDSERLAFEIEADVVRGDSGGPIFNLDGEVAGIIYAASRERKGFAFALRSSEISRLLDTVTAVAVDNGRCV